MFPISLITNQEDAWNATEPQICLSFYERKKIIGWQVKIRARHSFPLPILEANKMPFSPYCMKRNKDMYNDFTWQLPVVINYQ